MHGYTNGVTGGISANKFFLQRFYPEVLFQTAVHDSIFCEIGSQRLLLYTSIHFVTAAAFEASGVPAALTRAAGRTASLALGGALFAAGSLLQTAAVNIGMLLLGRVVAGLGLSVSTVSSLLYLCEVAPAKQRGRILSLFQVYLSFFLLLASLADLALSRVAFGWRLSCSLPILLGVSLAVLSLTFLPDSPVSLLERGRPGAAAKALARLRSPRDSHEELMRLTEHANLARCCLQPWRYMLSSTSRPQLVLSALSTILQQLTGINFLVFYGPQLFSNLGFSTTLALVVSATIDASLFAGSLVALAFTDILGRRVLLMSGSAVAGVSMLLLAVLLTAAQGQAWLPWAALGLACLFTFSYGWSFGPFGWTYPVEIQQVQTRSVGLSITSFFNVLLSAVAAQSTLDVTCHLKESVFFLFSVMCGVGVLLVWWLFPEPRHANIEAGGAWLCDRKPFTSPSLCE